MHSPGDWKSRISSRSEPGLFTCILHWYNCYWHIVVHWHSGAHNSKWTLISWGEFRDEPKKADSLGEKGLNAFKLFILLKKNEGWFDYSLIIFGGNHNWKVESCWIKLANLSQNAVPASWTWPRLEIRIMRFGKEQNWKEAKTLESVQFALSDELYSYLPKIVNFVFLSFNTSFYLV